MLDFSQASISQLIIHKIGKRSEEEGIEYSEQTVDLQDEIMEKLLLTFFVSAFKEEIFWAFRHPDNISLNEIYNYSHKVFTNESAFTEQSKKIADFLYEHSDHPNIQGGEFYAVLIKDCLIDDEMVDALGLFKTENKDTYLKIKQIKNHFKPEAEKGINIKKLDKGALIFNTEKEKGYLLKTVDNINKNKEARFWQEEFLNIKVREDNYYQTDTYLKICKNFADEELSDIEKEDRIALKNETMQYFKENDSFSAENFEAEVIANDQISERFRNYKASYAENQELSLSDDFEIAPAAVKKAKSKYKSVLKLDKNFHVYIHGDRNNIEKGYDQERNQKYYKLYYKEEQ